MGDGANGSTGSDRIGLASEAALHELALPSFAELADRFSTF